MKPSTEKFFFNEDNLTLKKEYQIKDIKNIENQKVNNLNFCNKESINVSNKKNVEKKKIKNKNIVINENENNNGTQKNDFSKINFIVDYNSYSKCSCYKIQCNKKYCECLKSNIYCISCYYQNCKNRPPINSTNNIKINHHLKKENEKKKVFCTCSKSECKLKYCKCFKLGLKCSNLCKCVKCKNDKSNNNILNICFVNNIYIENKELVIKHETKIKSVKFINLKIKKREIINKKAQKGSKIELNINKENLDGNLFDKNGSLILNYAKLNEKEFD